MGADTMVPVEMAKLESAFIEIRHAIQPYEYVIPADADVKRGEKVLKAGQVLRAQDVKLLMELKNGKSGFLESPSSR